MKWRELFSDTWKELAPANIGDPAQHTDSSPQMKTLPPWVIATHAAAVLLFASSPSIAQLAASGTPGDRAVYTRGTGASLAPGLGNSVIHTFDTTTVDDTADSFELPAGSGNAVNLTAGHHLVIYGTRYLNTNPGAASRAGLDNKIVINGSPISYGAASSYSRDGSNNNNFVRGGAIVEAAQGDTVGFQSQRTDNNAQLTIAQQDADLQLIKLDDSLSYLRLSASANSPNLMSNTSAGPSAVSYDVQDEIDAGFTHTSGSSDITLDEEGRYLVFANTGFRISGGNRHRQAITQRLSLNGEAVEDSSTVVYIRYSASGDGLGGLMVTGASSIGTIIQTSADNSVLNVEVLRDNNPATTNTAVALEAALTGLTILKLPAYGEVIRLSGPSQEINFPQGNTETALDLSDVSPVSNASFSYNAAEDATKVTVNKDGDYLFLASHFLDNYDTPPGEARTITRQGFQTIPDGGAAGKISYGNGGAYNRDRTAGNGGDRARDSGDWAGAVLPLSAGDAVQTSSAQFGLSNSLIANSIGLQALNIGSISSAPTGPTLEINIPLNAVVNSTGTLITEANLRSLHVSDAASALTYTVDTAPAVGTLVLSGAALGAGDTFTQADINAELVTFDAGTNAASGGFDFTVTDSGGGAASGSFTINVGAQTALTADAGSTDEDSSVSNTGASLLDNDTGSSLSVTNFDTSSANGAEVTVTAAGVYTYDPSESTALQGLDDGEQIDDTFTYTVTDIFNQQTTATVTITVAGLNDAPVTTNEAPSSGATLIASGSLLSNDSDTDSGDALSVSSVAGGVPGTVVTPEGATLIVNADGSFTYDPSTSASLTSLAVGASASETIAYEVTDGTATSSASITFTTFGETGASPDFATVDATGSSTAVIAALANDNVGGALGTSTAGAPFDLNASDSAAANTSGSWNNSNTISGNSVTMENAGSGSILLTPLDNSPPGITHAYDLSGTGSGGLLGDTDQTGAANHLYGGNFSTSPFSVEALIRPDDHLGAEPIWGSGGNGTGTSLILIDDQLILTIGNGTQVAQAIATIPANAIAGGDYVHVLGSFDIATDVLSLYVNGVLVDSESALNIVNGQPGNILDWSGSDDEGLGRSQGTTGGDVNIAPFLGAFGTTDIPDFNEANDRFDGEISILRVYNTALSSAQVTGNLDAIFGAPAAAQVANIATLAGETNLIPGTTIVTLPSGATVALATDGTLTYDANEAFDTLGVGLSAVDSFTYSLDTSLNAETTVTVTVNGTNTNAQINIAAGQASVTEGSNASFLFTSSLALTEDVVADLSYSGTAEDGSDFTGSASVTLLSGTSELDLILSTIADDLYEGSENVTITIDAVSGDTVIGANAFASVTISDSDDAPVLTIATPAGNTVEGSAADFTVSATTASSTAVTVNITASGDAGPEDYCNPSGQIIIPAGQTAATLSLVALDDAVQEGDEALTITISDVSIGSVDVAGASATATIEDGSAVVVFNADFEGIDAAATPGGTLLNGDAPFAANLGTSVGSWTNIFTADNQGNDPGVFLETGADVKGDGADFALRLDRPATTTDVAARLLGGIDLTGSNTGVVSFDLATRRTQGGTAIKSSTIVGLDAAGNKSFELFVDANNTGANHEQLFHVASDGTLTPIGNVEDFNNSGNYNEDRMSNVRILLTSTGYCVQIERYPLGANPAPDTTTSELPYAGSAASVTQIIFRVIGGGANPVAEAGGIFLDDIRATGNALSLREAWRLAYFGSADNTGNGADDNDTNGNGLSNFLDFAYGFDPVGVSSAANTLEIANPGANGTITQLGGLTFWPDPATGEVYMRYTRRTDYGSLGLVFTDQFSRDLGAFENATEAPAVIATGIGDGGAAIEAVQLKMPLVLPDSGGKARFGRNSVQILPQIEIIVPVEK